MFRTLPRVAKLGRASPADKYNVLFVVGDSNAAGRGTRDGSLDIDDARVDQYGNYVTDVASYQTIVLGDTTPLRHPDATTNGSNQVGPGEAMGRSLVATLPTIQKVLVVPLGHGGSTMTNWKSTTTKGADYNFAISQGNLAMAAAIAAKPASTVAGILICEGTNDSGVGYSAYYTFLSDLIANLRLDLTGASAAPVVIGSMVIENIALDVANRQPIDNAHGDAARLLAGVRFIRGPSANNDGISPFLHYNAFGYRTIGQNAAAALALSGDTTPDAFTLTDQSGVALSSTITSNQITISGLGAGVSVAGSITGGNYSKNGLTYASAAFTAVNDDKFTVQQTSSGSNSTAVDTTLTIGGVSDTFTSTTLALGSPVNSVAPAITGTAQEGQTLTCSTGTWSNSPTSYAYQWKRDGSTNIGTNASTYVPVTADVGHTATCSVTATNAAGSNTASSAATGTIASASYSAQGVRFGGTAYMARGAALTGSAAGAKGILSFWFRMMGGDAAVQNIFGRNASSGLFMQRSAANKLLIKGLDVAGSTTLLQLLSTSTYTSSMSGWSHFLASWDVSAAFAEMYVDGVDVSTAGSKIVTNGTISYAVPDMGIGAIAAGTSPINAEIADFYLNEAASLDITNSTNRALFRSGTGHPVDLGSNGSIPTGTAPIVFLSGIVSTWHTNDGTGGGFTLTNTLSAAGTTP